MIRIRSSSSFVFGLMCATLPSVAQACSDWDLSGKWTADQTNGWRTEFELGGDGASGYSGTAQAYDSTGKRGDNSSAVSGRVNGDSFDITVSWLGGAIGVYSGRINMGDPHAIAPQWGSMKGTTVDKNNPKSAAQFGVYTHSFKCLDYYDDRCRARGSRGGVGGAWPDGRCR